MNIESSNLYKWLVTCSLGQGLNFYLTYCTVSYLYVYLVFCLKINTKYLSRLAKKRKQLKLRLFPISLNPSETWSRMRVNMRELKVTQITGHSSAKRPDLFVDRSEEIHANEVQRIATYRKWHSWLREHQCVIRTQLYRLQLLEMNFAFIDKKEAYTEYVYCN